MEASPPSRSCESVVTTLGQASQLARLGDFGAAQQAVERLRPQLAQTDQTRLDAFSSSFRVDPAVWWIAAIGLTALGFLAALTLLH
jgi:hypothetical protein